jgi:type VI secretion system secreted protein Hcp
MKRRIAIGAALVAVLAAAATTYALAASGASTTQTINACVNGEGNIRLVSAAANCRRGESPISWNTVGPAGAPGTQGLQGVAGRDGQTGPAGPAGTSGEPPPDPDRVTAGTMAVVAQVQGSFNANVLAVSHEIVSPRDPASGLPTGKRMHKPITITAAFDASTPRLIQALVNNENLKSVTINFTPPGSKGATIVLTNASVSQYDQNGETVSFQFTYQKIQWTWNDGGITAQDDWEAPVS